MTIRLPFEWLVALRYLREGRMQTALILSGVVGGVAVIVFLTHLITQLQASIIERTLGSQAHIVIRPTEEVALRSLPADSTSSIVQPRAQRLRSVDQWEAVVGLAAATPGVVAVSPVVSGAGFALRGTANKAIALNGVDPARFRRVVHIDDHLVAGRFELSGSDAVIGVELAKDLGVSLGDRIRLTEHFLDPGVFIRSMANRGALGGLSEAALQAALLMDAAGVDVVLLETVGVGQAEVDVMDHADTIVLVLMPGSGDSIQALKAGVMEIPDVIVVNKADHPLTETMVREIRGVLALGPQEGWVPPIITTEATKGVGVQELAAALAAHREHIVAEGTLLERRRRNLANEVLALATVRLRRQLEAAMAQDPETRALLDEVVARRLDPSSAAVTILARAEAAGPPRPS